MNTLKPLMLLTVSDLKLRLIASFHCSMNERICLIGVSCPVSKSYINHLSKLIQNKIMEILYIESITFWINYSCLPDSFYYKINGWSSDLLRPNLGPLTTCKVSDIMAGYYFCNETLWFLFEGISIATVGPCYIGNLAVVS